MSSQSNPNNPNFKVNTSNTASDEIRPDYLGNKEEDASKRKSASDELNAAEESAARVGSSRRGASSAKQAEEGLKSSYTGKGKRQSGKKKFKLSFNNITAGSVIVVTLMIFMLVSGVLETPLFTIGGIDYNLQDALGFTSTIYVLEKLARFIVAEDFAEGEVPDALAGDLAAHGIEVGQVTAAGDFVRTNVYVADIEQLKDLAVLGHFETTPSEGQLAVLYDGEVISADDFVSAVESNMRLFADFSEALDISARYYYSNEVNQVYNDMGISRSAFVGWKDTGDAKKNQESFNEMATAMLDNASNLVVAACGGEGTSCEDESGTQISGGNDASSIVRNVASKVRGGEATSRVAELLNAAISSSEPYLAASTFMMIEEPIQQARIEGTGPVNELLNAMNYETEVSYRDVTTDEMKTKKASIMTTGNFVSVISGGKLSQAEAVNVSRDRSLVATNMNDEQIIRNTTVSTSGQSGSSILMKVSGIGSADESKLGVLDDSVSKAMVEKNSDLAYSEIGGNRAVEGGSFLSNTINSRVIGAMPSDEATIAEYRQEVKEVMARKAEADRATKSPFDISSPYTFMGSIVHSLSNAIIRNKASGQSLTGSVIGVVADMTDDSAKGMWGSAIADGKDDSYAMTFGDYCITAKSAASVEADIYCTPHTTISTNYMKMTRKDWIEKLNAGKKNNLDDSGGVISGSDLSDFIVAGMDRWSTVGVESADVCERYKTNNPNLFNEVFDSLSSFVGLYKACNNVNPNIATGAYYTMSDSNGNSEDVKLYAGYVLYDRVSSMLNQSVSKVTEFREEYYAQHPVDNSRAGRLARISGLSKADAETALAYADYLTVVARYNPANRYAFGTKYLMPEEQDVLVSHAERIVTDLYVMWHGKSEYADLRSRIQVA